MFVTQSTANWFSVLPMGQCYNCFGLFIEDSITDQILESFERWWGVWYDLLSLTAYTVVTCVHDVRHDCSAPYIKGMSWIIESDRGNYLSFKILYRWHWNLTVQFERPVNISPETTAVAQRKGERDEVKGEESLYGNIVQSLTEFLRAFHVFSIVHISTLYSDCECQIKMVNTVFHPTPLSRYSMFIHCGACSSLKSHNNTAAGCVGNM